LPGNTDKRTIILCDDSEDVLEVLTHGLTNAGYDVHAFSDPVKALAHFEEGCRECELLITDVRMPRMNGFQLVRRVRELRPDIKVIMMTAFEINLPEFEAVFPSMKVEGVLRKPFLPSKIIEMLPSIML